MGCARIPRTLPSWSIGGLAGCTDVASADDDTEERCIVSASGGASGACPDAARFVENARPMPDMTLLRLGERTRAAARRDDTNRREDSFDEAGGADECVDEVLEDCAEDRLRFASRWASAAAIARTRAAPPAKAAPYGMRGHAACSSACMSSSTASSSVPASTSSHQYGGGGEKGGDGAATTPRLQWGGEMLTVASSSAERRVANPASFTAAMPASQPPSSPPRVTISTAKACEASGPVAVTAWARYSLPGARAASTAAATAAAVIDDWRRR